MKGANVGQHPARRPEEPATGAGAQTVMTRDEMTAALEAGYATAFGQSFSWIAHSVCRQTSLHADYYGM